MGTLTDVTGLIAGTKIDSARLNGVQIKKLQMSVAFTGHTAGEGPILYGIGRDLESVALLKEALEADPQGFADRDEIEKCSRNVFVMGYLDDIVKTASDDGHKMEMHDVRFPWKKIPEGSDFQFWVFNISGATLTTGMVVHADWVAQQEWLV